LISGINSPWPKISEQMNGRPKLTMTKDFQTYTRARVVLTQGSHVSYIEMTHFICIRESIKASPPIVSISINPILF
jgi:hypothetical protein